MKRPPFVSMVNGGMIRLVISFSSMASMADSGSVTT